MSSDKERAERRKSILDASAKLSKVKAEEAKPKPINLAAFSDSDDEAMTNRIGNVPLEWYKDEDHIGYDVYGKPIAKKDRGDNIDAFLARTDDPNFKYVFPCVT